MLTLAATNTIAGVASVASKLLLTIDGGMEYVSGVETVQVLFQGFLPNAAATQYTAPASTEAYIPSLTVVNTDVAEQTFSLFVNGTAAAQTITGTWTLGPDCMAKYEDGVGWRFYDADGELANAGGTNPEESNFCTTACKAESIERWALNEVNVAALSSGRISAQMIWLREGTVITSLSFWSATTALVTGTNQLFGLYSVAGRQLLAQSVNDTSTAWAANTKKTLALATPTRYVVQVTTFYWIVCMVAATTVPTLKGQTAAVAITGPRANIGLALVGTANTGLTTALPAVLGTITVTSSGLWAGVN